MSLKSTAERTQDIIKLLNAHGVLGRVPPHLPHGALLVDGAVEGQGCFGLGCNDAFADGLAYYIGHAETCVISGSFAAGAVTYKMNIQSTAHRQ
jgi:hypothetical protein